MGGGLQAIVPLDISLGMKEALQALVPLDVSLGVKEDEAYVLGFVFLVALHAGRLLLVVLRVLPLTHVLGGCMRQWL